MAVSGSGTLVRTASVDDLDALYGLAVAGGSGLTNLPPDRAALLAKLEASQRAIAGPEAREAGAAIMLIVEHDGRAVGTSCVFPGSVRNGRSTATA